MGRDPASIMHAAVTERRIVKNIEFRISLTIKIDINEYCAALRIGDVRLRNRVSATLRSVDLPERKRARIRQLESMYRVVNFVFDLRARHDLKLERLHVWHIERGIENLRHHTICQR